MSVLKREMDALRAELAGLRDLTAALPADAVLERMGLAGRAEEVEERLREVRESGEQERELAQVSLRFDGDPVRGMEAIDAKFAGQSLTAFQTLISLVGATRSRGAISRTGQIPDDQYSRLQVVSTLSGSFGFVLEEDPRIDPDLGTTHVRDAIEEVSGLLTATVADDDGFSEAISATDQRVRQKLSEFLWVVANARASLTVATNASRVAFRRWEEVADAGERVDAARLEDSTETLAGVLDGYLPEGRRFEFVPESGNRYSGRLETRLDSAVVRPFQGKPCVATIRTIVVESRGRVSRSHILTAISSPGGDAAEDAPPAASDAPPG